MTSYRLGVDIGGTFTDIVLLGPDGTLYTKKSLSTPDDYSRAIEDGVAALLRDTGIDAAALAEFAHGTTVATNVIIERRGVKVALVTTKGFRDVLELGRFRSPRLYDLEFRKPDPLVERRLRFEVAGRIDARGRELEPLDLAGLDAVAAQLMAEGVNAVAVCFINSYVNPAHELAAAERLAARLPGISVSVSTQLLPQIQEYERTSTTVVNAYIRPVVEGYVGSLLDRLARMKIAAPAMIMQSSGGLLPAPMAGSNPVYIIESGPAAGIVGAQRLGQKLGFGDLMVLDMGGTTAKASIIENGRYGLTQETEVGGGAALGLRLIQGAGYVVQVPTIDLAEVGAGGGSIAAVDAAGGLGVGPRSAGAAPGPACYARGGDQPTVTDANLLLGYINPEALVGGELKIEAKRADDAVGGLGKRLGMETTDIAYGVHLIANANMMRALKAVSSERGRDPTGFTLLAIGGNGPVHAANLAEGLGITRIIVPPVAGLFSALGLLFADVEHHEVAAYYRILGDTTPDDLNKAAAPLFKSAEALLVSEGFTDSATRDLALQLDLKYAGQMATLKIGCPSFPLTAAGLGDAAEAFAQAHQQTYGYRSDGERIQIVAIRVVGRGLATTPRVPDRVARWREKGGAAGERRAYFGPELGWLTARLVSRAGLADGAVDGPLIIEEYDATTVVRPGWHASLDGWNNIIIERK